MVHIAVTSGAPRSFALVQPIQLMIFLSVPITTTSRPRRVFDPTDLSLAWSWHALDKVRVCHGSLNFWGFWNAISSGTTVKIKDGWHFRVWQQKTLSDLIWMERFASPSPSPTPQRDFSHLPTAFWPVGISRPLCDTMSTSVMIHQFNRPMFRKTCWYSYQHSCDPPINMKS